MLRWISSKATEHGHDLAEVSGLTGTAVAVGGITGSPWWGLLTGSVGVVLFSIATGRT